MKRDKKTRAANIDKDTTPKGNETWGWKNLDRLTQAAYNELEAEGMFYSSGEGTIRATDKGIIAQKKIEILLSLRSS